MTEIISLTEMLKYIKDPTVTDEWLINLRNLMIDVTFMLLNDKEEENNNNKCRRMHKTYAVRKNH